MSVSSILLIGGFDSSGGAGIAADIKAASHLKTPSHLAISCFAIQSHSEGAAPIPIPIKILEANLLAAFKSNIKYVKIGVIGDAETAFFIKSFLIRREVKIILDTPIFSSSGFLLQDPESIKLLAPISFLVTPNIAEYKVLGGKSYFEDLACSFLVKSAVKDKFHLHDELFIYCKDSKYEKFGFTFPFLRDKENVRGTGCVLSTFICALLNKGELLFEAVKQAGNLVFKARQNSVKAEDANILFF